MPGGLFSPFRKGEVFAERLSSISFDLIGNNEDIIRCTKITLQRDFMFVPNVKILFLRGREYHFFKLIFIKRTYQNFSHILYNGKLCGNVYYQVNRADVLLQNMVRLASFNAINVGKREIGILAPRREHEGVCPHEGQGQPAKQLARDLPLLNPLAPCQRACQ